MLDPHLGIQYLNTMIAKRKTHGFISTYYFSLSFINSRNKYQFLYSNKNLTKNKHLEK